ncbi:MAG: indolepyruvate ferredoxin oxidoreductase subunit alpha [Deltaproteobacteria bacterium]|jgi:indolepyruvate ferredoxin oxidoreductase alpha subunit|nr:indolepyruvate ferredoxin oxidoreductase subunit alpha [Deltaproteobacteria bacterium]MDH3772765.1 indolepyruvate ferredoxin oxidoreductase subunit alpha [Deltaproteobacteria bacterium]MDH3801819.1 indolepyruvate ferredoxin oxidoreductase subunit alpha [Deltaproteobacteria bacterium]MDH3849467.1 indolepyruvate ferredoxin oxidoreductase subunit alpha [Deltaproteobacteria bacterium]MDH3896195.1 indolepyruvate ferredoxin oxidoreductase subunit alpha [Deltaproteobacteria bacterium]
MHELLTAQPGSRQLLLGNEAIVRGALEAGISFATTYPGTPSSEIGDNFYRISQETDLYFEYSVNEKVALETAAAAAISELRTMCSMKHVGLNVAADALMTLAYVGVKGGLVVVSADDPSMHSSQNEQDNRYYAQLAGLPMLEPANSQEALEMTRAAFELSEAYKIPVLLRTTTRINHSRTPVEVGLLQPPRRSGAFKKDPFNLVTVPMVGRRLRVELLEKINKLGSEASASPFNRVEGKGGWGVVTSGVSYNYVADAVRELDMTDRVRVLKMGMTYPFADEICLDFLKGVERVLVVEELEPFLEDKLKILAQENGLSLEIRGKGEELLPRYYEFDPVQVKSAMARFFQLKYQPGQVEMESALPQRPPNLCAGCPHRASYYAVNKALGDAAAIYPTDIGCYTLGILPPLEAADFLLCMGSSVSSAGGFAKAQEEPVVAFIGDSTFFHSGITGLINAVHNDHNFILVILDNGTTAMTGQQPHPGIELTPEGRQTPKVDIEAVVRGCGVDRVETVNPLQVDKTVAVLKEMLEDKQRPGVKVLISKSPCPLFERRVTGKKQKVVFRVTNECDMCRRCLDELGCPAFTYCEDEEECAFISIDEHLCSGCSVCKQICHAIKPKKKTA